jgi:maltose/moltooligosaccharide transporter
VNLSDVPLSTPSERFPVGRTLLLGAMFMGMGMTLPIFNHFVPIFLREMALSATLITFILTWDNYLNMFMQPIVGQLSDRTRTRIGRRKPWVLVGAPIALTAFLFVPSATTAYGSWRRYSSPTSGTRCSARQALR